jgi:hypothetical protein
MKKLTPKQLEREAAKLIREGRMPSIEKLAATIVDIRRKYRLDILRARRDAREAAKVQLGGLC